MATKKRIKAPKAAERAVVVCTELRGVFFGWATDTGGETIKLRAARNCYYWAAPRGDGPRGILGLGSHGPQVGSRIGSPADVEIRRISCVIECTAAAVASWESASWVQ